MRSLLFVPADSEKKRAKGMECGADALILDLEDSVALSAKPEARLAARAFLEQNVRLNPRPLLLVRVNAFDTGLVDADLEAVIPGRPDAIMLPKCSGPAEVTLLDAKITTLEAIHGLPEGAIGIHVVATETAEAIFTLGAYKGSSARLSGLTWGAEDLAAAIGAQTNRMPDTRHTEPFRLARSLCLFGAVAAGAQPIDTVYAAFRDETGLTLECEEAVRDGFTGKMAIHPAQVPIINRIFSPSPEAVAEARKIVEAFRANPGAGVLTLDGAMIDRPHLVKAERTLARAGIR